MEKLTITGVPEHFNYPWLQVIEGQPFLEDNIQLVWQEEPKGSGAMNKSIRSGDTDIAIVLTESFVKDRIEGNPGKIIGYHVLSPLTWGIHVSAKTDVHQLEDLKNATFLVSRSGSGSHLMAFLLAKQHGWDAGSLNFEIVENLDGAIRSFKNKSPKGFLWEKYTTKPLVDKGLFRRVGEIPTPWPCFVMVASPKAAQKFPEILKKLQGLVYKKSTELIKDKLLAKKISQEYHLLENDVKEWLGQTQWATDNKIKKETLENTMVILKELKLIPSIQSPDDLIHPDFAVLV